MNPVTKHFMDICETFSLVDDAAVLRAAEIMRIVRQAGGTVWIAGNGGSAATASHFANDLTKAARVKAISIPDLGPTVLAFANDTSYDNAFTGVTNVLAGPRDAFVGISYSGNSYNVFNMLSSAKTRYKIALVGPGMSKISEMHTDVLIRAMSDDITVVEDVHMAVCHAISNAAKENA